MDTDQGLPTDNEKHESLDTAREALVDAAGQVTTLWTTYILALLYFYVATAGVTPRDLFLESPIKLPFLSIELPLRGYFWFGPFLVWVLHVYVLIHVRLLADKVNGFGADLMKAYPDAPEREHYLRRLPINLFVQQLATARLSKTQAAKRLLSAILWLTLVVLPAGLFVFFELRFLPYHDELITWIQRLLVIGDVVALMYFWPGIASSGRHPQRLTSRRSADYRWPAFSVCVIGAIAALNVFYKGVFPGEQLDLLYARACSEKCERLLKACGEDTAAQHDCYELAASRLERRESLALANPAFPAIIYLENFDAANTAVYDTDAKFEAVQATLSMAGRNLVGAVLNGGNFRKVDFSGADLSGAQLANANLRDANLERAQLDFAVFDDAEMPGANLHWTGATMAQFKRATLSGAKMEASNFSFASFDGAVMIGAQLNSSTLAGSSFKGSNLAFTQFTGAFLLGGQLQGSFLGGANLDEANLVDADLSNTILRFASVSGARVYGAKMNGASLQLSIVKNLLGNCQTKDECDQLGEDAEDKVQHVMDTINNIGLTLASPILRVKMTEALSQTTAPGPGPAPQKKREVDSSWFTAENASDNPGDRQREFSNWLVGMVCNSASDENTVFMVTWGLIIGLAQTQGQMGEMSAPLLSPQCRGTFDLTAFDRSTVVKLVSRLDKLSRRCKSAKYGALPQTASSTECEIFNRQPK